ncbi:MAG: cryptochrome/photolyase family protein [Stagnimonas sp.]|nr:cryptochrome/photolyase family protein [Stagnimonas sp.]
MVVFVHAVPWFYLKACDGAVAAAPQRYNGSQSYWKSPLQCPATSPRPICRKKVCAHCARPFTWRKKWEKSGTRCVIAPTPKPKKVVLVQPGEWRLTQDFSCIADESSVPFETRADSHFVLPLTDFADWMKGRKQPRLEHFYR